MSLRIQAKQPTVVNLLSSPEDLTASPWTLPSVTALSNTELAPDGTHTACKFTYLSIYSGVDYDLDSIVTTGETYTLSVYAKATTENIAFTSYGSWHNYNVRDGYAPDGQNAINASITPAANGFYRCAYTFTVPADHTYHNIRFWLGGFNGSDWTGNTMTLWGAQLVHRPNLLTHSSDFNHAPWDLANIDVTSDSTTAPDGTMTADTLTARNQDPYLSQTFNVTAGVTYIASVYVKAGSANSVGAQGFIWSWYPNWIPGAATGPTNYAQVLHTLNNDWQYTYITFTPTTSGIVWIRVDTMERNWIYAPGDYTYMWGASLIVADDIPYYPQSQLNSGVRIQSRQLPGYVDRGLQFYIDAANTASNLTTAIADISGNNYTVGLHNATVTTSSFQVRNTGTAPTQCIVTQFDDGILKSTNKPGTWTLEAYWKNISAPCSGEAFIVGRIGWHGGIYCYDPGNGDTTIWHAIKTADGWTGAFSREIASVAPGETVHSVMTYNDGWISSYINGELIQRVQWDYNTYGMTNYDNNIRIGGWDNDSFPQYGTNSDIYTIRCYSTELTAQEVEQNYQYITKQSKTNSGFRIQGNNENIVRSNLIVNLDAAYTDSYPGTGLTWYDLSGTGKNATLNTGTTYVSTDSGVIRFNGSSKVTLSTGTSYSAYPETYSTDPFSVEVWIRIPSSATWNTAHESGIFHRGTYAGYHGLECMTTNNQVRFALRGSNPSSVGGQGPTATIQRDQWTHIVGTVTTGNSITTYPTAIIYKNGQIAEGYIPIYPDGLPEISNWVIGNNTVQGAPGSYFNGDISVARVYRTALTSEEVLQNYNASRSRYGL